MQINNYELIINNCGIFSKRENTYFEKCALTKFENKNILWNKTDEEQGNTRPKQNPTY